jgi:hypothetical protein
MERKTEEHLKLAEDQLKLSLDTTQEFIDMWTKSYQSTLGKLAQVPTFGPVREKQEKIMKSMPLYSKLYTTWVDSNINLQNVLLEAMRRTFEKTTEYQINSATHTDDDKSCIDSEKCKEFYKIWIDTYSNTFKEFTKSEHYASDMGKFASVFIDLQKYNREMIEENYLKPNNLPTKTDIDEIYKELYSLRKTVKGLVMNIPTKTDIEEIHKESSDLRETVEELAKDIPTKTDIEEIHKKSSDLRETVEELAKDIPTRLRETVEELSKDIPKKTDIEKIHKESSDLRKTVEDLVVDTKELSKELHNKEEQAKKVELHKEEQTNKVEIHKEEQTKKTDLATKKEVHTK